MLLIQIDRNYVEMDRRTLTQFEQHIEQAVAVFATRQADHDFVAILNHIEVANRLPDQSCQTFFELIVFVVLFLFIHIAAIRISLC